MKKIVAFLLVAVMVLSCLPVLAGSNTAQTKDKINPDIKVDAKLDKTTLDLSKKDDVIKGTFQLPVKDGYDYRVDNIYAKGSLTYEQKYEKAKAETVTNAFSGGVYNLKGESGKWEFDLLASSLKSVIDNWFWDEDRKFVSAAVTVYLVGCEYVDGKRGDVFFYEFPAVAITGYEYEPPKPVEPRFAIEADKKILKTGEDFTVSLKFSGKVPEEYKFNYATIWCYAYVGDQNSTLLIECVEPTKIDDKFVFSVPATNCKAMAIKYEYELEYVDPDSKARIVLEDWDEFDIDVNVTTPDEDDLVYSPENAWYKDTNTTVIHLKKDTPEKNVCQISITGKTADVVIPTYTWGSNDEKIATVDANGLVKFLSEGFVTISGKGKVGIENYYYKHQFLVIDSTKTESLVFTVADTETIYLKKNAADQKNVTIDIINADPNGKVPTMTWTSSNPAVATVNGNTVTGVAVGTAVISGTGKIGDAEYTHSFTVVVEKNEGKVKKAIPSKKKISLKAGKKATIELTFKPDNLYAEPKVTWKSSDKKVATVKNGKITAKKAGTCTITAKVKGLKKAITIKVTVK